MVTEYYTLNLPQPLTQQELRQRQENYIAASVCAGCVTAALLTGILIGVLWARSGEPRQQVVGKLEVPTAASVTLLEAVEMTQPEQVRHTCTNLEKARAWDVPLTDEELDALLEACEAGGIAPEIALGLIQVESSFRADAVNEVSRCYGYCQLNPQYFPGGLSPVDNIRTGIGYLAEQLERYDGDLEAALAAYNAGYDTGRRTYAAMVLEAAEAFERR